MRVNIKYTIKEIGLIPGEKKYEELNTDAELSRTKKNHLQQHQLCLYRLKPQSNPQPATRPKIYSL